MSTARATRQMAKRIREEKEVLYDGAVQEERENRSNIMMKFMLLNVCTLVACPVVLLLVHMELSAGNYGRALCEFGVASGLGYSAINCLFKKEKELDDRLAKLHNELQVLSNGR